MMDITLYSTGCMNCKMLEAKLKAKNIKYQIESDMNVMEEKGLMSVPALEVDGKIMNFRAATEWINRLKEGNYEEQ